MLSYTYDGQNQLTTVKNGSGTTLYSYSYDTMGNIRSKTDGSVTHLYTYGNPQWADLLTAYDGHTITYDGSGNPLSYYNGADYTFTWEQGRQLASVTKGSKTASYTYDMSGVRSGKTVNGVSYEYTTLSGKITRMTWSGNAVGIVYDDAGRPYILRYTPSGGATQTYYYVLNLQGDVVGLMNTSMQMVVRYSYDPWGKLTGTTATSAYVALAQANPLRYRSYCYDIETGFYYLQTRYYDPAIARFINADGYLTTDVEGLLSANMFAYCENNPVMYSDSDGEAPSLRDYINNFVSKIAPMLMEAMDKAENMVLDAVISAMGLTEARLAVAQTILGENDSSSSRADWKLGVAAIAWTIINRVNDLDSGFPNTAYEVVTAPYQYHGYGEGKNMAPNGILIPKEASRQKDWEYINKIAAYVVLKKYDKIPYPEGFTDKTRFFAGGYTAVDGPMIYGGNKFRDQY